MNRSYSSLCEQRSGEILFSTKLLRETTHSIAFPIAAIYFSQFSSAKSHVKSQNRLTPTNKIRSSWHFSYAPTAILKTVEKNK
jgi:hypothetical protein